MGEKLLGSGGDICAERNNISVERPSQIQNRIGRTELQAGLNHDQVGVVSFDGPDRCGERVGNSDIVTQLLNFLDRRKTLMRGRV